MIGRSQWLSRSESIPWQSVQQVLYKFLQILIPPMEISSHALYIEMCNNIIYHWLELHLNCCQAQFQYVFAAANDLRQHYYRMSTYTPSDATHRSYNLQCHYWSETFNKQSVEGTTIQLAQSLSSLSPSLFHHMLESGWCSDVVVWYRKIFAIYNLLILIVGL